MSTFVELLPRTPEDEVVEAETVEVQEEISAPAQPTAGWNVESYAEEQIRGLVRRIFLPGWPKPSRQVVFSAVDQRTDVSAICTQVGQVLSAQASGTACVVDANPHTVDANGAGRGNGLGLASTQKKFGALRDSSFQLSSQLWLMPKDVFLGGHDGGFSVLWLRSRLAELRLEFDYTILQGPPAGVGTAATLLGAQCDGIVLIVEANSTRRVTAQRVKEELYAANVRLLGTVLSERTFPIPQSIYSRL